MNIQKFNEHQVKFNSEMGLKLNDDNFRDDFGGFIDKGNKEIGILGQVTTLEI